MDEVRKFFQQILQKVDGLHYVQITDKDGVPFMKINSNNSPDFGNKLQFLSNFGLVADQASKLGVGRTTSITAIYSKYQVIQIYCYPLVVTLIANADANTGYIHSLESQLEPLLIELKDIVAERHDFK